MKVMIDDGAFVPTRAHELDAGLDLYAVESACVPAKGSCTFDTGVHVEIPPYHVGFIKSKSGLMVKHNIVTDGTVDAGYTGSIVVKLFNHGLSDVVLERGQKIAQLTILPIITPEIEITDSLEETERGNNGFGSTGAF